MKQLVVGVDGSTVSRAALVWASQVALKSGAEILALNCLQEPKDVVYPEDYNRPLVEREQLLDKTWTDPARATGAQIRSMVCRGDARDVLIPKATTEQADLLVLGRTGSGGGPGLLHLGSVVEHAAHHTQIPLAVIPAGWTDPIKQIVVGVDGSPESLAAIFWLGEVAPSLNASVTAVHVQEPYLEWTPADSPENWRREAEQRIEEWVSALVRAGVEVTPLAQRDLYPVDGLLGVAATRDADLLVVGTRGVGGFTGLRAGGVALKILHRANLPLVLVPKR